MTSVRLKRASLRWAIHLGVIGLMLFSLWFVDTLRVRQLQSDPAAYRVGVADGLSQSNTDTTIATMQARIKQNENDQQVYTRLAAAYLQKSRETGDPSFYGKSESLLHRALEMKPDDFVAMAQMGSLSLSRHQFAGALDWGMKAKAISPDTAMIYGVIGDAQVELGQYDAAIDTFQTMVDLRPDLSSYSRASYIRELHGDVGGAIEAMQLAVEAGGPNAENTNWTRVQLGHLYFNRGDLVQAEAQYRQALEDYPGYIHAMAGLARVYAARRDYDSAIKFYSDVVNRMPLPEYVIALGDVYEAAGRSAEAKQQFDLVRAIEKLYLSNGVDTDLEMALFEADHAQGQGTAEAVARARRALEKRPTIFAASVLAWALYQDGQSEQAYDLSKQSLRLGTHDALLFFHTGMIAYRAGHPAETRSYLEKALALNPDFSIRYRDAARDALAALKRTTGGR